MRTVYRVQAEDGRGPWRPGGFSLKWIDDDAPVGRLSETLMDLVPMRVLHSLPPSIAWGCACRSLDELMSWFTPLERRRLRALGFHPVRVSADVVIAEGKYQLLVGRNRPFSSGASRLRWPEEPEARKKKGEKA